MKIEHLYQFLVIAETGSISKAAQNLFVSQQHLSRIVSSLEETLQCSLLVRNSTGIELTSYGISFLKYAKKILEDYNEMQTFFYYETLPVAACSKNLEGTCHISIPYFFSLFLNDFISELKTTYPNIELQCSEHTADGPENNCLAKIYLVLGDQFISDESLSLKYTKHHIGNTQTSVCVNRNSPLAYNKIITKEIFAAQMTTVFPQSALIQQLCACKNILFTSSNIYQHLDSVQKNLSICIVPSYIGQKISQTYPDIILLPFELKFSVPMYIIYSNETPLTDIEKTVIRFLVHYLQKNSPKESFINIEKINNL